MKQRSGNSSNNIQVAGDVNFGVSSSEAREIALDVFKSNFYELSENAAKTALKRAEELTDDFIGQFFEKGAVNKEQLENPAIQSSLYNSQKNYAKSGDKELKDQLLSILLDRIGTEERSLKQIVLDEAIDILPKLTKDQINLLSLIVSIIYIRPRNVNDLPTFIDFINSRVLAFYPSSPINSSFIAHLQFAGCCTPLPEGAAYRPLTNIILTRFKGLFIKGFSIDEFIYEFQDQAEILQPLLIKCLRNPTLYQFNALSSNDLESKLKPLVPEIWMEKAIHFQGRYMIHGPELEEYLYGINIKMKALVTDWSEGDIKSVRPTPVGIAIGTSNLNSLLNTDYQFEKFLF